MKDNKDPIAEKIVEMEAEYLAKRERKWPLPEAGRLYRVSSVSSPGDFWPRCAYVLHPDPSVERDRITFNEGDYVHVLDSTPSHFGKHAVTKVITPCGRIACMSSVLLERNPVETE